MAQIEYFVPGDRAVDTAVATTEEPGIAARLRRPVPAGVTAVYVEAYAQPGEAVLVPYCQGAALVWEILAAGRQALAVHFDPVVILVVQASLFPPPSRDLDAAVARLGDSLKGRGYPVLATPSGGFPPGVPLRQHLESAYTTVCPACLRPVVADYFVWDREDGPVAKYLRCPVCDWDGQTGVEPIDRERIDDVPARGMHYHYLLDRMTSGDPAAGLRTRLESLLNLYSARNLYALAELTLKIESLFPEGLVRRALEAMLLDCLDRCSSLTPANGASASSRSLARPPRFLERNVWRAFEEAAVRLKAVARAPALFPVDPSDGAVPLSRAPASDGGERAFSGIAVLGEVGGQALGRGTVTGLADGLEAYQAAEGTWAGSLGVGLVRDLPRLIAPRSVGLMLFSPPPLDSVAWSLSYFWGAWLLGAEAVRPLRGLVQRRQRTPDASWYASVMTGALATLVDLLRDDGRMVLVLTDLGPATVEALLLAATRARLGVARLIQCDADYRLELTPTLPPGLRRDLAPTQQGVATYPSSPDVVPGGTPFEARVQTTAVEAGIDTIRARGEPVPWRILHAAMLGRLAVTGLLDPAALGSADDRAPSKLDLLAERIGAALEDPAFVPLPVARAEPGTAAQVWWLAAPGSMERPLADRVEHVAYHVLHDALALTGAHFFREVYRRFPEPLTPDPSLVTICLQSYGDEVSAGYWQLRTEDRPSRREAEHVQMTEHLRALGRRLGYQVQDWPPFDVGWSAHGRVRAVFLVRSLALLGEALGLTQEGEMQCYLVIPGSRSALVSYKLAHNPLWQRVVDEIGWRFVKYRHIRELVTQRDVDEYTLRTVTGLDPPVERETAQLSLF